ncbi:MAG: hypothetical protein ACRD0Y_06565 [Terriglobales bacterium]
MPAASPSGLRARLDAFLAAPTPTVAVEIAAGYVAAGRLRAAGTGHLHGLRAWARSLPAGAIAASAVRTNVADGGAVAEILRALLDDAGGEGAQVTLLVPDLTARLALLTFEQLPAHPEELVPLASFRLRKSLPFAEEHAVISCQPLTATRMLVAFADRARIAEYEDCLERAGARAAAVLPAGLACLAAHAVLDDAALLLRADSGCLTSAFCRHGRIEFFRALEIGAAPVFEDAFPSVAYFRDALESGAEATPLSPVLFTSGLPPALSARLAEESPWATLQAAEVPVANPEDGPEGDVASADHLLAVAGALRGRFA